MTTDERRALLTLCLAAAFADGAKSDPERAAVKHVADRLADPELNVPALCQDVLLGAVTVEQAAARLTTREARLLAYEMALGVCEADDALHPPERAYLTRLRAALGLEAAETAPLAQQAEAVMLAPVDTLPPVLAAAAPAGPRPDAAVLDRSILNHAILAGALELLPGSLATMAIIPLQMKLVYALGKAHGHELDRGHIREFLATAGLGLTAQVVEGYAVKLMRGLLGKMAGGLGRAVGGQLAGSALAFATTYAVGQLAKRYYAGGRTLSGVQLRAAFQGLLGEAKQLQARHLPEIRQRAATLDPAEVLRQVAGR
jgi:uncharacterized protein (DUF697 family)/uncharacterized tellurite resistance protein B-like protein